MDIVRESDNALRTRAILTLTRSTSTLQEIFESIEKETEKKRKRADSEGGTSPNPVHRKTLKNVATSRNQIKESRGRSSEPEIPANKWATEEIEDALGLTRGGVIQMIQDVAGVYGELEYAIYKEVATPSRVESRTAEVGNSHSTFTPVAVH